MSVAHVVRSPQRKRRAPAKRLALVRDLRCECGRPGCTATIPVAAEGHRRSVDSVIVVPAHFAGGVVVRAADRFFVVEPVKR
jgi:hypothetical protein